MVLFYCNKIKRPIGESDISLSAAASAQASAVLFFTEGVAFLHVIFVAYSLQADKQTCSLFKG